MERTVFQKGGVFRIFRILALDPITGGRIRKGIPWNLVPFPILLLHLVLLSRVTKTWLIRVNFGGWTGLRDDDTDHHPPSPPAWQYNNLIRSHIHGKPSGRFPWGDHTGAGLMKTNSTFLGVGEGGRTTAVIIQNVGHTLLASYRAQQPQQTPGSSVFRGTKQLQRSPVIETNSIFLSPTFLPPYYEFTGAFLTRLF